MAGTVGFEPTHAEIKTQSLTTWRRPIICKKLSTKALSTALIY